MSTGVGSGGVGTGFGHFFYMQYEAFEVNGFYFQKWHSISEA